MARRESLRARGISGAPRGLLRYYILSRAAEMPVHGYQLMQEVESKTNGAWRPGPGTMYLMLKELRSSGLVQPTASQEERGTGTRAYTITEEGKQVLADTKKSFTTMGQRMSSMRGLLIEMIDPEHAGDFIFQGASRQFELAHELLQAKGQSIGKDEMLYILRQYQLLLEKEIGWVKNALQQTEQSTAQTKRRIVKVVT